MTNSTVEIKDGKVLFSKEILEYFEDLRNKETSEWIDKYFEVLSNENNLTAEKYNIHHIRPCCTFKDKEHKNRKQTKPLADKFNGNLIKLSVYNHLVVHYYLWKIFDNYDSKNAFQHMCGVKIYIENLSEDELFKIALLQEECVRKNQTKEEKKEYNKKYHNEHKEERKEYDKKYYNEHKEKFDKHRKIYQKEHKNEISEYQKNYREEHKDNDEWKEYHKNYAKKWYQDNKDVLYEKHKKYNKEHKEEQIQYHKKWEEDNKEKRKEQHRAYGLQKCIDPIYSLEDNICTYSTLNMRKHRHPDLYKDVIPSQCIIKENQ